MSCSCDVNNYVCHAVMMLCMSCSYDVMYACHAVVMLCMSCSCDVMYVMQL